MRLQSQRYRPWVVTLSVVLTWWIGATPPSSAYPAGGGSLGSLSSSPKSPTDVPLRTLRGRSVELRTDTDPRYAKKLQNKLDSFIAQANTELTRVLEVPKRAVHTTIIVFESQQRYQRYARRHAPALVNNGGYYDGGGRTVVTYRFNNSMQLFFHELVHAIMAEHFGDHHFSRYTRRNWPIWFDEGMSEYLGSYAVKGSGIHIPAANKGKLAYLGNALRHRAFVPLRSLLTARPARFSGASMNIYYAESWGLINYLVNHAVHRSQLPLFFRKIRSGVDGLIAFKECFGEDLVAFESSWLVAVKELIRPPSRPVSLFSGHSIDDWTVHEGGTWRVADKEIRGHGNTNYNYLIKSEVPMKDFTLELEMMVERGTAGLILGNNYHGEYPYYYLVDVARDVVMLRRSYTATRIDPVKQAFADLPLGKWARIKLSVIEGHIALTVNNKE
ncbi:MAG TPA: hypothetical protein DCQ06_07950, partial [Myxococcales bacterium]|nr:hypothetical protein [Myxococcales bacterium]